MLRLGDVVSRHGFIPEKPPTRWWPRCAGSEMLAEAAGAVEIAGLRDQRDPPGRERRRDRRPHRARDRASTVRRDQRARREARLIFGAIRASVLLEPAPALCFDLGGGSLEVMVGDAAELLWATSEPLGVGPPHRRASSTPTRSRRPTASAPCTPDVDVLAPRRARRSTGSIPRLVVGSSGTFENLAAHGRGAGARRAGARVAQPAHVHRDEFLAAARRHARVDRGRAPALRRARTAPRRPHRRRLDVPGHRDGRCSSFDEMTISDWALREGIVLDAVGHHDPADWSDDPHAIRRAAVQSLARRCSWPEAHSQQVARLAVELFDETARVARARCRRPRAARVRRAPPRHRRARRAATGTTGTAPTSSSNGAAARLRAGRGGARSPRSCDGTVAASRVSTDELPLDAGR